MSDWKIEEYDSLELIGTYFAPGVLSESEMSRMLKQLASRHLQPSEIISSNLRLGTTGRTGFLEVRNSDGTLQIGLNPYLVARKVK